MEFLVTGFLLGLMGSFHCVGMCGPIALSLPLRGHSVSEKVFGATLYNLGRTITYGIMGGVFGLIGQGFHMIGFQQSISVIMGILMIASILVPSLFRQLSKGKELPYSRPVRRAIQNMFTVRSFGSLFIIGLLNGLLPCGLVYMAVAGAIGTGNTYYGILYMVLFGLGTIPMLLFISILGNVVTVKIRNSINKTIPFVVCFVGIIFILRGLSLGIPYLSPPREKMNPAIHMKNTTPHSPESIKGSCCLPGEPDN